MSCSIQSVVLLPLLIAMRAQLALFRQPLGPLLARTRAAVLGQRWHPDRLSDARARGTRAARSLQPSASRAACGRAYRPARDSPLAQLPRPPPSAPSPNRARLLPLRPTRRSFPSAATGVVAQWPAASKIQRRATPGSDGGGDGKMIEVTEMVDSYDVGFFMVNIYM